MEDLSVTFLGPVFWVIVLLGVMILIHELGHYWAALSVGVRVDTFSIGFGPRLTGFRRGDTDFRLSAIPFGGYVRMLGEQPGEDADDPRSFQAKARWQRAIVVAAGPLMNILLAVAIVTGLYMTAFPKDADSHDPMVTTIAKNSAADLAGVLPGDRIVSFGGQGNPNWQDVMTREALNGNHALPLTVLRGDRRLALTVTPKLDDKQGIGVAGWTGNPDVELGDVVKGSPAQAAGLVTGDRLISIDGHAVVSLDTVQQQVIHSEGKPVNLIYMRGNQIQKTTVVPSHLGNGKSPWRIGVLLKFRGEVVKLPFFPALRESLRFNERNATMIFGALRGIVERRVSTKTLQGPIGMAKLSSEAAHEGPLSFLFLMAVVSLNLAIFNLLPIPILDGATLLMLAIEMIMQREMSVQLKENVFKAGFVLLMMVVVFVIYNDISRILTNG